MKLIRKTTTTRVCSWCKRRKPKATAFYGCRGGKDGLMSHCKACVKKRYVIWCKDNPKKWAANRARSYVKVKAARAARLAAKRAGAK
jgi:hypothetical protein